MPTYYLDPNGDITADWIETPTGAAWSAVDDAVRQPSVPNGADYLTAASAKTSRQSLTTFTLGETETVTSVTAWAYEDRNDPGACTLQLYKGATQIASAGQAAGIGWKSVAYTGSLTQAEIDDLRISVDHLSGALAISGMYAEVTTTLPSTGWTQAIDDTAALADAISRAAGHGIPDTLALADSPAKAIGKHFGFGTWADIPTDHATWLDVRVGFATWLDVRSRAALGETAFLADAIGSTLVHGNLLTLADSLALADEITLTPSYARTKALDDILALADELSVSQAFGLTRELADAVALADSISTELGGRRRFRGFV